MQAINVSQDIVIRNKKVDGEILHANDFIALLEIKRKLQ